MNSRCVRWFWALLAVLLMTASTVAFAQDSFDEKKEATLSGNHERKKVERKTLEQEEGSGPKVNYATDEMTADALEAEKIESQASAIKKLQLRINQTDDDDPDKPTLMERLGDMLFQKAKYYELRSFDYLNEYREADARGDTAKAAEAQAKKEADEKTAKDARDEMLNLYKEIIKYFPEYKQMDKIRYYMAFNLAEMGYVADANEHYMAIVREHSNSPYLADAFLGLAEYTFTIDEDMPTALKQYQKVVDIDSTSTAASYAMYKQGWCYFNLGQPQKALSQFEKVIREAEKAEAAGRHSNMRSEAVKDLVKAFSMWPEANPAKARNYFSKFTKDEEETNKMMERLARLYQEDGDTEKSIFVYRELIEHNPRKFQIVNYQYEIMLNIETLNDAQMTAQEINNTVKLFTIAKNENYEGATPEKVNETFKSLEEFTRETAKWYHQTYNSTKNPLYYALAYEIYRVYLNNFPETSESYELYYLYADMAYWKKNYAEAAKYFEKVISLDPNGQYSADSAHGAVLAYQKLIEDAEGSEECPSVPTVEETASGEEFPIAECRLKFIEASKRYAKIDTSADFAINAKYRSAKIYYDYNHFDEAEPLFHEITQDTPEHALAMYSANLLLDIYIIKKDFDGLWNIIQELKANQPLMAQDTAEMAELKGKLDTFEESLQFKFCKDMEDKKDWEDAARCYEKFAADRPNSPKSVEALWNASTAWENSSEVGRAIDSRVAMLQQHGDNEHAPRALYAIAQNFHGIAVYSEAARFYEMFVDRYPNDKTACVDIGAAPSPDPCAKFALQNAAVFRTGLGEFEQAVNDYDKFARMFPKDQEQMADLKYNIGRIYFDQKKYDQAINRFSEYLTKYSKYGPIGRTVSAQTAIGRAYWQSKKYKDALKAFEKAENAYYSSSVQNWLAQESSPADKVEETKNAGAEARFMRGESLFKETMAIQLSDDSVPEKKIESYLQEQLKKKAAKMQEAAPVYTEVIQKFGSPKWGLAAMCRLGMMYHDVSHQIEYSPIPKRLTEEQALIYQDILFDFAGRFEDQAVKFYETAVKKAAETGWFSEYTVEAQKRLFELRPLEYRSASEIKAQPNKVVSTYHSAGLYTDLNAIRDTELKTRRKVVSDNIPGESTETAAEQPAGEAAGNGTEN